MKYFIEKRNNSYLVKKTLDTGKTFVRAICSSKSAAEAKMQAYAKRDGIEIEKPKKKRNKK